MNDMFRSKKKAAPFSVTISKAALESIFDDCDKFATDETGGRLLGTYKKDGEQIEVHVTGVLEAGPSAERSPTFFLQDGDYQEKLFRAIEETHPEIEHLGNWHTHHVNGLQTLSSGDKRLYDKIVNHENHNTDFFYALLVVRKNSGRLPRYTVKHFFFRRGDLEIYEVTHSKVLVNDSPLLYPGSRLDGSQCEELTAKSPKIERARDQQFFDEFYPDIKPLLSKTTGTPYWKGSFPLVDGSLTSVVAMEQADEVDLAYAISMSCQHPAAVDIPAAFKEQRFTSARRGVLQLERELNRAIFQAKRE